MNLQNIQNKLFSLSAYKSIQNMIHRLNEDKITVYAAQASFFIIISVTPFLSLLISIISLFVPAEVEQFIGIFSISEDIKDVIGSVLIDLQTTPKISLLSVSAIVTLWSASRGTSAIRKGVETVYHSKASRSFLFHRLRSLFGTVALIILVVATVILLLFGDYISNQIGHFRITDIILHIRIPVFILLMSIVFTTIYTFAARRSSDTKTSYLHQLPGAVFSSVGWMLFSYFYSLYIKYFPNASYIYGGLAAICLSMLWIYFCMIILFLGAELNILYLDHCKK